MQILLETDKLDILKNTDLYTSKHNQVNKMLVIKKQLKLMINKLIQKLLEDLDPDLQLLDNIQEDLLIEDTQVIETEDQEADLDLLEDTTEESIEDQDQEVDLEEDIILNLEAKVKIRKRKIKKRNILLKTGIRIEANPNEQRKI